MKFPTLPNPIDVIYPSAKRIRAYIAFCHRRPIALLSVALLLTILATIGTVHLYQNVDTSLTALLPDSYQSVKTLKKIDQEGAKLHEHILVEGPDSKRIIAFSEELKTALEKNPLFHRIQIKRDVVEKKYAFLLLPTEELTSIRDRVKKAIARSKLKHSGFFISLDDDEEKPATETVADLSLADLRNDRPALLAKPGSDDEYFISRDKQAMDVRVFPVKPPSDLGSVGTISKAMHAEVDRILPQHPEIKVSYYGPYRKRMDEVKLIQRDVNWIGTITLIAIVVSLILYFRQVFPILVIIIPLAMGLLWTLGVTDLLLGRLNTISAFLVGIITGMGADFCIYLYSRYLEEREEGKDRTEAMVETISHTGRSAFTSGMNTALVFFSLTLADFKGFSEFGFIAGLGLVLCYLAIYTLLPCLIIWFEDIGLLHLEHKKKILGMPWPSLPGILPEKIKRFPLATPLVLLAIFIVIYFGATFKKIEFEYDFGKLRSDLITYTKEEEIFSRFNMAGGSSGNAALLVMNSMDDIAAVEKAVDEKIKNDPTPTLKGFSSFYNVWPPPDRQAQHRKLIDEIRELLPPKTIKLLKGKDRQNAKELLSYLNVEPYPKEAVPNGLIQMFSPRNGPIGSYGYVLALPEIRTRDGRDAIKFADDAREVTTERGTFYASSQELVFADVLGLMLKEGKNMVVLAIFLVGLFVWLDFYNLKKTLLVLIPVTTGTMLTLVLLHSLGGKITFYNMIVLPMIIGMGEDNAVHIYHRYTQEGRGSICKCLRTTGKATWMASVTNILGFLGLAFSHHKGLQSIGFLAAAGLLSCLICNLLILPAIVQFLEDRFQTTRSIRASAVPKAVL